MGQPGMPHATACGAYQTFLTPTNQTPLTVSSTLPLEVVMQLFKRMGYVHGTFLLRSRVFLTASHHQPTCYPRGGFRHVGWAHDRQGRVAPGTPRTTEQSDDRME
jgi:hypothetical protein